jgi:hypothetical protein
MSPPRISYRLQLSQSLGPEEVSQAWQYLASLPSLLEINQGLSLPEHPPIPKNLRCLTDADWYLLDNLLARELHLKSQAHLH